jgi:hypothetical protein
VSVDWVALSAQTAAFDVLDCQTDPGGRTTDVVAVGLRVKLSEVAGRFTAGHASSLLVYADTLDVDVAVLPAPFCVIVARSVSGRGSLGLPAPDTAHETVAAEVLTGSALTLVAGDGRQFAVGQARVPTACTVTHELGHDPQAAMAADAATIGDLTGRPYALNALQATFSAATRLAETTEGRPTAREMLAWITQLTTPATGTATDPTPWTDLYRQAQPLLIMLMVQPGASYVPALSSSYYQSQLMTLLDTLDSYDASLNTLATSSDITKAVAAVAATTTATAADELRPLQAELASLNANLEDLNTGINTLNLQFQMQSSAVDAAYAKLKAAIVEAQVKAWFTACIDLAVKAIGLSVDAVSLRESMSPPGGSPGDTGGASGGGDDRNGEERERGAGTPILLNDGGDDKELDDKNNKPGGTIGPTKAVVTAAIGFSRDAISKIEAVAKGIDGARPLVERSKALVESQSALLVSYYESADQADAVDNPSPVLTAIDSDTMWDNYLIEAQTALGSIKGSGSLAAALTCLANFGKALAAKVATASGLYAQRRIVLSRVSALKGALARWNDLEAQSKSRDERLAALRGLLQGRIDSIHRSVYVAWQNYASAYGYLYFTPPPVTIGLDMDTAALRAAVASMGTWISRIAGDGSSGQQITLPNNHVRIEFHLPVAAPDDLDAPAEAARLWPADGGRPAFLSWYIPMGAGQLRGVLPAGGKVALWIFEAAFFVAGASGNSKGNLLAQVTTSGTYQNGFGPSRAYRFVSRPIAGNYAYTIADSGVYNHWKVPSNILMTPTPYTQWTLAAAPDGGSIDGATQLHMRLTVSYREAP